MLSFLESQAGFPDLRWELLIFVLVLLVLRSTLPHVLAATPVAPLPPGPRGNNFPLLGYLPFLGRRPVHETLMELADSHGPLFRVQLGATVMVVVADAHLFREAFKRDDLAGRPRTPLVDGIMDGYGLTSSEGPLWRSQRSFAHGCLRQLGMLRGGELRQQRFEQNADTAVEQLLEDVDKQGGTPFDPERVLSFAAANILLATVMSKTYEPYDAAVMEQLASIHDSFQLVEQLGLANFIPSLLWLPAARKVKSTLLARREHTRCFFRVIVEEHRATLDPENPRDFIDHFLLQMQRDVAAGETSYFSEVQLLSVLGDLFSAGTETTKVTIRWLLLAILRHPNVQHKIQQELDHIVGRGRPPRLSDRPHLPYTEACIQEILRLSSIVPTGAPHSAMRDVVVGGYLIPKGAMVAGLLYKFHRDPTIWKTPDDFNPEHFLAADGSLIKQHDHMLAFSAGRRVCLGEDVARSEIFLMVTSLLQRFTFSLPDDIKEPPSYNDVCMGILRAPKPFLLVTSPR